MVHESNTYTAGRAGCVASHLLVSQLCIQPLDIRLTHVHQELKVMLKLRHGGLVSTDNMALLLIIELYKAVMELH